MGIHRNWSRVILENVQKEGRHEVDLAGVLEVKCVLQAEAGMIVV